MKLGILVNRDNHLDAVLGIVRAARSKGHEVTVFVMDDGTKLLALAAFTALCSSEGVTMSFCDHSAQLLSVATGGLPEDVVRGSQYNNAVMFHTVDKAIVL